MIRKHHLSLTARHHVAKHPGSILASAFPTTCDFELDFAEFLDDALLEEYELTESLAANEAKPPSERTWWILKPGMSDRAQGIRLFSTTAELAEIFESFEGDSEGEGDGDDDDGDGDERHRGSHHHTSVVTSQLRHFVAQKYVHPPLLVGNRKFHIRAYVLAMGGLQVHVFRQMLALFAAKDYAPPWDDGGDLAAHLTNTCLQTAAISTTGTTATISTTGTTATISTTGTTATTTTTTTSSSSSSGSSGGGGGRAERDGSVSLFWDLAEDGVDGLEAIWDKICATVAEVFEAAARGQRVYFQVCRCPCNSSHYWKD